MSRAHSLKHREDLFSKPVLVGGHVLHTVQQPYKKSVKAIEEAPPGEVTLQDEKDSQAAVQREISKAFGSLRETAQKPKRGKGLKILE
jgi:dephospho-CoA kinase